MENIKKMFEQRVTVRRYEREPIPEDALEAIHAAICNIPTSYNGQQFSVIEISNQEVKEKLYELTGQKQIKTCARFYAFCADYHKIHLLAEKKGVDWCDFPKTVDGLTVGIIDASLAMMGALVTAQMYGLGCCCIGYLRTANPEAIARVLNVPDEVFVVCGLAVGVPREIPDLKPKQPKELVIHSNHYCTDDMLPELVGYDAEVQQYNRTRSGSTTENDWCAHIINYYKEGMSYRMREFLESHGFGVK